MAKITRYVEPDRLYRYRSLRKIDRELDAIKRSYLFCSSYVKLNDPMEGVFSASRTFRHADDYRVMRSAISETKDQIGICSFSETYDHALMWAHYADQFRGICVAYRFPRLLDALSDSISFARMYYDERVPIVRQTGRSARDIARMVLCYKNQKWLYEREWRMFSRLGEAKYRDPGCVACVYLGSRISAAHRARVVKDLGAMRIELREMVIDKYDVSFEAVND